MDTKKYEMEARLDPRDIDLVLKGFVGRKVELIKGLVLHAGILEQVAIPTWIEHDGKFERARDRTHYQVRCARDTYVVASPDTIRVLREEGSSNP